MSRPQLPVCTGQRIINLEFNFPFLLQSPFELILGGTDISLISIKETNGHR